MNDVQYPIGKFQRKSQLTESERSDLIQEISETPANLRKTVHGLLENEVDTPYRPGGWTVRQVVHHLPDSHMNAYIRMKLALTETQPLIKPYNQSLWAELHDGKGGPIEASLTLLESLHQRWVLLMKSLQPKDFLKTMSHPEQGIINIDFLVQLYGWHGRHHVAQIMTLRERQGWK